MSIIVRNQPSHLGTQLLIDIYIHPYKCCVSPPSRCSRMRNYFLTTAIVVLKLQLSFTQKLHHINTDNHAYLYSCARINIHTYLHMYVCMYMYVRYTFMAGHFEKCVDLFCGTPLRYFLYTSTLHCAREYAKSHYKFHCTILWYVIAWRFLFLQR